MGALRCGIGAFILSLVLLNATGSMAAEGWQTLPFRDAAWSPDFTLALSYGNLDPETSLADSDPAPGLQFSLNCPWFTPPQGMIRQQFNYNRFDEGPLEISTLEMNPRYYFGTGDLTFGVGPGVGYVWVDRNGIGQEDMWAFQLGADLEYRQGRLFLGLSSRYQFTESKRIGTGNESGMDNWLTSGKVGINF